MHEPISIRKKIIRFAGNRMFILIIVICCMFYFMVTQLFDLQIMRGAEFAAQSEEIIRTEVVSVPAPRGHIYDRFGRPLAINRTAYTIRLDPSIRGEGLNDMLLNFANLMEAQGQPYETDFPISRELPRTFLFSETETRARRWREDMNVTRRELRRPEDGPEATAQEVFDILRQRFGVSDDLTEDEAWQVLGLRSLIYMYRYRQHLHTTVAYDVSKETIVLLEEHSERFLPFYADIQPLRVYPAGHYVSHMIGYIRRVTEQDLATREGYSATDNIGRAGLELAFETNLRGVNGVQNVTLGAGRRPIAWETISEPVPGDHLYTTIDLAFQQQVYHILVDMLRQVLTNKMLGLSDREDPITQQELFRSMVRADTICVHRIMESEEESDSYVVKQFVLTSFPEAMDDFPENINDIKAIIYEGIDTLRLTPGRMLLVMAEQGTITANENEIESLQSGRMRTLDFILQKIAEGEITPQMTNLDPSTGTVVVVCVATGDVLAAVNYPSYDNNQFVNHFNNEYWFKLNNVNDRTRPLTNRAFMEPRAPGSTFKMITAVAGLEFGVITPRTRIFDGVAFTRAGNPPARCWHAGGHGHINVVEAIAVSCNYFFSEMTFNMGNFQDGNQRRSIDTLNRYMVKFGLNERSGVEIGEYRDTLMRNVVDAYGRAVYCEETGNVLREPLPLVVSSPEFKEHIVRGRNRDAHVRDYGWFDIDTVFTSFGQSYSNYTAATMAKYTATLASRGTRNDLRLMHMLKSPGGEVTHGVSRSVQLDIAPSTFATVHEGMVATTAWGTAQTVFAGFPITVAGKTGTAQEIRNRSDHASFAGYAPANNPQIAVYVLIPFGDTATTRAPAAQVTRDVIGAFFNLDHEPERPSAVGRFSM